MRQRSGYFRFYNPLHGFTLVELLVVISIIALLLAVLLPSLGKAREAAQKVICATRIKELALFNFMYADNNKGRIPPHYRDEPGNIGWSSYMAEYITGTPGLTTWGHSVFQYKGESAMTSKMAREAGWNSVLSCPSTVSKTRRRGVGLVGPSYARNGYFFERAPIPSPLGNWTRYFGPVLANCKSPSATIFFSDTCWGDYTAAWGGCNAWSYVSPQEVWWLQDWKQVPHGRFFNIAWADGHVSSELPQDYDSFVPRASEWDFD